MILATVIAVLLTVIVVLVQSIVYLRSLLHEANEGWGYWRTEWEGAFERAETQARLNRLKRNAEL
jgi:hypothetical protein